MFSPISWIRELFNDKRTPIVNPRNQRGFRPLIETLEERLAPATRVWDGGGGSNISASLAANWYDDLLPNSSDTIVIDSPENGITYVDFDSAFLTSISDLRINTKFGVGVNVNLSCPLTITDSFIQNGGVLNGSGSLTIGPNAVFEWLRGYIQAGSVFTVEAGGTANIRTSGPHGISCSNILNLGTINFFDNASLASTSSEGLFLANASTINFQGYGSPFVEALGTISLSNGGTINKSGNDATVDIRYVNITSLGQLNIALGTLSISGGAVANQSNISIGKNGVLAFENGTYQFQDNSSIVGNGTLVLAGGAILTTNGPLQIQNLTLADGTIDGSAALTITEKMYWANGTLTGGVGATTNIATNAVLYLIPDGVKILGNRWLNVYGKIAYAYYGEGDAAKSFRFINAVNSEIWKSFRFERFLFQGNADDRFYGFASSLSSALAALKQAEMDADNDYTTQVQVCEGIYQESVDAAQDAYDAAIFAAESAYSQAPEGDVEAEEAYWDAVANAEAQYDSAIEAAAEQFLLDESALHLQYRASLQLATNVFETSATVAESTFRADLRTQAGIIDGMGSATEKAIWFRSLFDPNTPVPAGFSTLNSARWTSFQYMDPLQQLAVSIAYYRWYGVGLIADLSNAGPVVYGDEGPPLDPEPPIAAARNVARETFGSWGNSIYDAVESIAPAGALDGMVQFGAETWNNTAGFVRDTGNLLHDDPSAVAAAIGEGVRDGALITANTLTFGIDADLNQHVTQLVADNGGLYRVSQVSAMIAREAIVSLATAGATRAAAGAGSMVARSLATRMGITEATQATVSCVATSASRLYQPISAVQQMAGVYSSTTAAMEAYNRSDYESAAVMMMRSGMNAATLFGSLRESIRMARALGSMDPQRMRDYLVNCFAAGTPIRGEHGAKAIERYRVGERVWARPDDDADAPAELKAIEEVFVARAAIWHVHVDDQVIRTTDEHPFYVRDKGWTSAKDLRAGDVLVGQDEAESTVHEVYETGEVERVYNFRVADHHTYFVGNDDWGFSVWCHNTCVAPVDRPNMASTTSNGFTVRGSAQATVINGIPTTHAADINAKVSQITAGLQAQGINPNDVTIVLNRSWRTALNNLGPNVTSSTVRPDIVVVRRLANGSFQLDAYECWSPGNGNISAYNTWLNGTFSSLVPGNSNFVKGIFQVF